ncbi:MAG: GntR family transcriptional regulator [Anaerolineaceae bacterium]|nr:GntR family transcriptional regulator [Anaerolineaceae bacterium]
MNKSPNDKLLAREKIEHQLRDLIITLELPPGNKISENDLIEKLNCGRTPLREALHRLSEEYLIISVPRRGISIAELNITDYVQLIEAVSHLEGITAKLAAQRATVNELSQLKKNIDEIESALRNEKILSVVDLDFEFHYLISKMARNRYLKDTVKRLHRLTSRFIYLAWKNGGHSVISLEEHQQIYEAILNKDFKKAQQYTFEHTMKAKERIINAL